MRYLTGFKDSLETGRIRILRTHNQSTPTVQRWPSHVNKPVHLQPAEKGTIIQVIESWPSPHDSVEQGRPSRRSVSSHG
ncbi:hypothetical protein VTN49DRAFT_6119 [Thermomyces lanuginosus]|uniref:uncharacterized protein n=1 Tax=Thermomyces lanuginosus TaxID=5541 RepID=UPI0037445139